jgi:hypothetical protein
MDIGAAPKADSLVTDWQPESAIHERIRHRRSLLAELELTFGVIRKRRTLARFWFMPTPVAGAPA